MSGAEEITTGRLPEVLREVADLAGIEVAVALARTFGGRRRYFPKVPAPDHPVAKALGLRAARLICGRMGGQEITIPRSTIFLNWYDARRLRRDGLSAGEIAKRLRLSERTVFRLTEGVERGDPSLREDDDKKACPVCGKPLRPRRPSEGDPRQLTFVEALDADHANCQRYPEEA